MSKKTEPSRLTDKETDINQTSLVTVLIHTPTTRLEVAREARDGAINRLCHPCTGLARLGSFTRRGPAAPLVTSNRQAPALEYFMRCGACPGTGILERPAAARLSISPWSECLVCVVAAALVRHFSFSVLFRVLVGHSRLHVVSVLPERGHLSFESASQIVPTYLGRINRPSFFLA